MNTVLQKSDASPGRSLIALGFLLLPILLLLWMVSPTADPESYLHFADHRDILGIPCFWNVLSNIPFLIVGIWAWNRDAGPSNMKASVRMLSAGLVLTAFGSTWFHLDPTPERLFWDRLPMSIAFMATLSLVLVDRLRLDALWVLEAAGVATVLNWRFGTGDLRPYALVQYGALAATLVVLFLFPIGSIRRRPFLIGMGFYLLAKAFEVGDSILFRWAGEQMSGHSLKHLTAAIGAACVVYAIRETKE